MVETIRAVRKQIAWQAQTHPRPERPWLWYLVTFGLFFTLASLFLVIGLRSGLFAYYLTAALFFVLPFVFSFTGEAGPRMRYELTEDGVRVSGKLHPWRAFRGFWLSGPGTYPAVFFEWIHRFRLPLRLPVPNVEVAELRRFLRRHLPEREGWTEDFFGKLVRRLGI